MSLTSQPLLSIHEPLLVNIMGHCAGAIVFGIFLALVVRDQAGDRLRGKWLLVASAVLALLWNVGSLTVLLLPDHSQVSSQIIAAASFSVLSLLPAVLLHLSLQGTLPGAVITGYVLSTGALLMHLSEAVRPDLNLHKAALLLVTAGFAVLTAVSVARVLRSGSETRGRTSRIIASMCLMLFAISFAHFGSEHPSQAWSKELVVHHAGIPLALLILLQDYRFVLLDAFVRFLANVMLAALMTFAALQLALRLTPLSPALPADPLLLAAVLAGSCFLLISFAFLRRQVQQWLTRVVFRRGDLDREIRQMRARAAGISAEADFLPWAAQQTAEFLRASRFELMDSGSLKLPAESELAYPALITELAPLRSQPALRWAEAVVPLRIPPQDIRYLLLGRRLGGRRYLSEDLRSLSRLSAVMVEELERFRNSEMQRLVSQAELRALQSQINPHFLFNVLNTVYGMIPREASAARRTVQNLADIFRYSLQSERTLIPLSEEWKIVNAYLEIERLRLGPRVHIRMELDDAVAGVPIPILSVQPLVENAIKHGLSATPEEGWLTVQARLVGQEVIISVEDSGSGGRPSLANETAPGAGVGLANVTRRLQLCYGPQAGVIIQSGAGGTKAQFSLPVPAAAAAL